MEAHCMTDEPEFPKVWKATLENVVDKNMEL
jgi:hypothetical protein